MLYQKNFHLGSILCIITATITLLYYLHAPYPEITIDSPGYLEVVKQLHLYGNPVHPARLPIYPLMIVVVYFLAGQGNIMAVCIVQGIFFVLTALELYSIALLLFRQPWIAFCFGLLIGTNLILLSYCKPLMTEGLSLWLLTTSILLMVLFTTIGLWILSLPIAAGQVIQPPAG